MAVEAMADVPSDPIVVVCTGGPCAGKTSAMATVRSRLSVRGFQVITVPENATLFLANSDGFQPEWAGSSTQVEMQRIFIEYQMNQEDSFKAFARLNKKKRSVIMLDCCTLNSKLYLSEEQWAQALNYPGRLPLTEAQLLARYDLIIHMVTCAHIGDGTYEWGPTSNNPGRYHNPEQAKEADARGLDVFSTHPQLRVVPHFDCFEDKIVKVMEFLNDALHVEGLVGKRRRICVRITSQDRLLEVIAAGATSHFTTTSFLGQMRVHSVRRRAMVPCREWLKRLKSRGDLEDNCQRPPYLSMATDFFYEQRQSTSGYLKRDVIKEDAYYLLTTPAEHVHVAQKYVLSFVADGQYYEVFFFGGHVEQGLVLDHCVEAAVPDWMEEVSDAAFTTTGQAVDADLIREPPPVIREPPPVAKPKNKRTLAVRTTEEAAMAWSHVA